MEDDKQHPHPVRKETETNSSAEEVLLSHNTHNRSKGPTHKSESSVSEHKEHHQHHYHQQHSIQPKTTTALTATYNVNVQFDSPTPQAAKLTHLSLIVTEQKSVNQSSSLI